MKELYTIQGTADALPHVQDGQLPIGTLVLIIPIVLILGLALGRYSRDREEREKKLNKLLEAFDESGGDVASMSASIANGKQQVASAVLVPPPVAPAPPAVPAVGNVVQLPVPAKRAVPAAPSVQASAPASGSMAQALEAALVSAKAVDADLSRPELELVPVDDEDFVDPNPGALALFDNVPPPESFGNGGHVEAAYQPSDEEVQEAAREAFAAQQQ